MIDTVKVYTSINKDIYLKIYNTSIVKSSINKGSGELLYEVVNDSLEGSYSSKLSVRVGCGVKYHLAENDYYIEIEGSYHKIWKGYNAFDGIYNLQYIVNGFIELAENSYDIKLPSLENWYLQRIDIAKCFDIENQNNVCEYINSLSACRYARRKLKFYANESLYSSGTTTTLKIYNKALEFKKHDQLKFKDTDFNIEKFYNRILGFIRFECEIKKKRLQTMYGIDKKHICVKDLKYSDFEQVWSDEFMKLLGMLESDLKIVRGKEEVKKRLLTIYGNSKGMRLFNFYCSIQLNGIDFVQKDTSKSVFYRNINALKECNVDYSQVYQIQEMQHFWFNPFEYEEVI